MNKPLLLASVKSALLLVAMMLVQHVDELWRGGATLSVSYLAITLAFGVIFTLLAYQFHCWRYAKNPAYKAEWLHGLPIYIGMPVLLVVLTIWRG